MAKTKARSKCKTTKRADMIETNPKNHRSQVTFDQFSNSVQQAVLEESKKTLIEYNVKAKEQLIKAFVNVTVKKNWDSYVTSKTKIRTAPQRMLSLKLNHVVHIYWCGVCGQKENLTKCSLCCVAYHLKCKERELKKAFGVVDFNPLQDSDVCPICCTNGYIKSGDIVWHKLKTCPWWPARIISTTESTSLKIPPNPHYRPVYYFGTKNFGWAHEKQMCLFNINYDIIKNKADKVFQNAVLEANIENTRL